MEQGGIPKSWQDGINIAGAEEAVTALNDGGNAYRQAVMAVGAVIFSARHN